MLNNTIIASLLLFSTQTAMALSLEDVNNAANNVNEANSKVQQTADKVDTVDKNSVSSMAKKVATDSAKGGVDGALDGAAKGSIVDGGTKGAVDGAKTSINKLGL